MEWFNTSKIPETGKRVILVCNYYSENQIHCRTISGTFKKHFTEDLPHCFRIGLTNNSDADFIMNDIQAWTYEKDITDEAVRTVNERPLEVYCPHCKENLEVITELHNITFAETPVLENTLTNNIRLGWEYIDFTADLKYVCKECRRKLANTYKELANLPKKEVKSFADDSDKVLDLFLLSKEEFLKSYSYITEEEYDNTVKVLKENIGKKGK